MVVPERLTDHDRSLHETNESIRADSPFGHRPLRTLGDVEYVTAGYVAYNQQRPMHGLGRVSPAKLKPSSIPNT